MAEQQQVPAGTLAAWAARADIDRWDVLCVVGLVVLTVGLWCQIGFGVAMAVLGALVLALGIVGAFMAGPSGPEQTGG